MGKFIDLTGRTFGKWQVLSLHGRAANSKQLTWQCVCECGTVRAVLGHDLRYGKSKCCGCTKSTLHGMTGTTIYQCWKNMKQRCSNPNSVGWQHYGGRGIKVCDRWANLFAAFQADMSPCPEGYEIDRIDTNGDYEPNNCRWATITQNLRNTRRTRYVTYQGQTKPLNDWCDELNLRPRMVYQRLHCLKWDVERAFTTPPAR